MDTNRLNDDAFQPLQFANQEFVAHKTINRQKQLIQDFLGHKLALLGIIVLITIISLAILGPVISGQSGSKQSLISANLAPDGTHWFGTDDLGRDVFTRIWLGVRISLVIGVIAALVDIIIGIFVGAIAGYAAGRSKLGDTIDNILMRIVDVLYGIPYLLIVILLLVLLKPGLLTMIIALSLTGWVSMARIVRGQVLQLKQEQYIKAAELLGTSHLKIIQQHILPNIMGVIIVNLTFTIPSAIFAESFLSFLGLGIQAPSASLGTMANDALGVILSGEWWRLFFPSLFIALIMFCFNVIGDGLQDTLQVKGDK
ncbi:ABC transporter permease [Macrococcus capreoli]|uniref:ABC transporter permease n=1 Tax=Macrococcus capreoli TaxID=2982690 RepID=UPI0021D5FEA5|nr:ABC transporter permease [Macrococcus sp. TMW 2.2395]MCU7556901.1 ABC transporter permease [Macrococcus sp. TMW 2.2395]